MKAWLWSSGLSLCPAPWAWGFPELEEITASLVGHGVKESLCLHQELCCMKCVLRIKLSIVRAHAWRATVNQEESSRQLVQSVSFSLTHYMAHEYWSKMLK
jgi:hypothetical protein